MADREQFERRLLALVRDYLNETDEEFPEGYEIEDFIVLYQVRFAPPEEEDLRPWHGGPSPRVGGSASRSRPRLDPIGRTRPCSRRLFSAHATVARTCGTKPATLIRASLRLSRETV
jgi:hypothetical protein